MVSSKGIEPFTVINQFFYREPPLSIGSPALLILVNFYMLYIFLYFIYKYTVIKRKSIEDVSTVIANWRDIMSMIHLLASLCSMCMKARPSWNSLLRFKTNNIDYAE